MFLYQILKSLWVKYIYKIICYICDKMLYILFLLGAIAGKTSSASTLIKNQFPKAIYIHCASHKLNLCVAACCTLPMVADMMSQFQAVALFFSCSLVRTHVLRSIIESVSPKIEHSVVLNICRTR